MGISQALGSAGQIPVGTLVPFAGVAAPANWLFCAGQAISRTTFSGLFLTIGTTYGTGDGSTTFNLPDLRGRVPAGKDDMNGTPASRLTTIISGVNGTALGASGGDQRTQQHTHIQDAHAHNLRFPGSIGGNRYIISDYGNAGIGTSYFTPVGWNQVSTTLPGSFGVAEATTPTNQNFGSGVSQNVQPTVVLNYIIRAV